MCMYINYVKKTYTSFFLFCCWHSPYAQHVGDAEGQIQNLVPVSQVLSPELSPALYLLLAVDACPRFDHSHSYRANTRTDTNPELLAMQGPGDLQGGQFSSNCGNHRCKTLCWPGPHLRDKNVNQGWSQEEGRERGKGVHLWHIWSGSDSQYHYGPLSINRCSPQQGVALKASGWGDPGILSSTESLALLINSP